MQIEHPYLLFLGDARDALAAKTGLGIVDWRRDWCLGQMRLEGCKADAKLPDMGPRDAAAQGAKTMVIGVVNAGGVLPEAWIANIVEAIESGLDIASGMHVRLGDIPAIREAAEKHGRKLHDVRLSSQRFDTGKGDKRSGMRLLTVGTDCSAGKKYTALALEKGMRDKGFDADFKATGQTGVFISGRGAAIDAVVADFISGAVEWISPEAAPDHWDLIEGQGSLFHPSFAGVTLGLLHGSQPDAIVLCHDPSRRTIEDYPHIPLPPLQEALRRYVEAARLTNPAVRCTGVAINSSTLSDAAWAAYREQVAGDLGLPVCDPLRGGVDAIAQALLA
jgi:uncharacterized NAD-dependent epimerase/dehydratase family protein